jgi:DNA-binding transcriptional LysR family regulator
MNLLHLRYFYEVARTGSFTESARTMRISQPAISKMVRQLEEYLDTKLIERARTGIKLTQEGEVLYQRAGIIFAEVTQAENDIKNRHGSFRGNWSLGVSDTLATYCIPKAIKKFQDLHPELRISLFAGTSTMIKAELHYDRCDAGLFFTPLKPSEPFHAEHVFDSEFWIVLSAKNPWSKKRNLTLADIKNLPIPRIESRHRDYSSGFPAHFHSKKLGLDTRPGIEANQHDVKKHLVLEGLGFSILTKPSVEQEVRQGKLLRISTPKPLPGPVYAIWKQGRTLDPISKAFFELLKTTSLTS